MKCICVKHGCSVDAEDVDVYASFLVNERSNAIVVIILNMCLNFNKLFCFVINTLNKQLGFAVNMGLSSQPNHH